MVVVAAAVAVVAVVAVRVVVGAIVLSPAWGPCALLRWALEAGTIPTIFLHLPPPCVPFLARLHSAAAFDRVLRLCCNCVGRATTVLRSRAGRGTINIRDVGSLIVGVDGPQDDVQLRGSKFQIGDYLDIAIFPPRGDSDRRA